MTTKDQIVHPKDLTERRISSSLKSSQIDLTDNERRHAVVGIALNNYLVPQIKQFVDHQMKQYYEKLKKEFKIHTSESKLTDKVTGRLGLNIHDQKCNSLKNIKSHNELAKHYQKSFIAKNYKSILDESTDASAILSMLTRSHQFSKDIKNGGIKIRDDLRNEWAHCNVEEWTDRKYFECFNLMIRFVDSLAPGNFSSLKSDLLSWQENGIKVLGKYVEPSLIKNIFTEISFMNKKVIEWSDLNHNWYDNITGKIEKNKETLEKLLDNFKIIEEEHAVIKENFTDHGRRITKLEQSDTKKPPYNLPPRQLNFTGRTEDLQKIQQSILQHNKKTILSGLGGIGKTSLALEFAHLNSGEFPGGVFWITADTENDEAILRTSISELSLQINISITDSVQQTQIVTNYFRNIEENVLLVVDNLDTIPTSTSIVNQLVNGAWINDSKVSLLITTRIERPLMTNSFQDSSIICLDTFNVEDAVIFLCRRSNRKIDEIDSHNLAFELGYLPLALDQAAVYLKASKNVKVATYLARIKGKKEQFRKKATNPTSKVDESRLSVKTTWQMNIEAIKRNPEFHLAETIMFIFSFLSPQGIPREILNKGFPEIENEDLLEMLDDECEMEDIIQVLTEMSLFEETSDSSIKVHRLVQDIIKKDVLENPEKHLQIILLIQRMLSYALTSSDSPEDQHVQNIVKQNWDEYSVASLQAWKKVAENAGYFLNDLPEKQFIETDESFLKMLDHLSLYHFVQSRRDQASSCSKRLEKCLSTMDKLTYKPKFKFPIESQESETLSKLMEPRMALKSSMNTLNSSEDAKNEGDTYMYQKQYALAIQAYNKALEKSTCDNLLRRKVQLNKCHSLFKMHQYDACITEAKTTLNISEEIKKGMAFVWISLSYLELSNLEKENLNKKNTFLELAKMFEAISLYFSVEKETQGRRKKQLSQLKDFIVVEIGLAGDLKEMIRQRNITNLRTKGKVVLYFQPGIYDFPLGELGNI